VCDTLAEAVRDCTLVIGASVRERSIELPPLDPPACAEHALTHAAQGEVALVFGPEHSGLSNADLDLCQRRVVIPSNPAFPSLNIGAAVQVLTYELYRRAAETKPAAQPPSPPATHAEVERLFEHLERVLERIDFLRLSNPQRGMRRLRALVNRAAPDQNEVQILRGILSATEHALAKANPDV
jgi:TrmH family RNA methyltransferase